MSSPTRYQPWRLPLLNGTLGQADEQEPDPDPSDPIDYAASTEGGAVQVGVDVGSPALIQSATGTAGNIASSVSATFGATPEIGNTLIAFMSNRNTGTAPATPSGWTRHSPDVVGPPFDGGRLTFFYKVAGSSEPTTVSVVCSDAKALYIAEWSGLGSVEADDYAVDNIAASTSLSGGPITPAGARGVIFAGFVQSSRTANFTMGSGFTGAWDVDVDLSGPSVEIGYLVADPFTGSYTATATSDENEGYGAKVVAFAAATDATTWYPAPQANDGDTGTSAFSDSPGPCLRVALFVERLIYRVDLDVGMESAGATAFELYGTDDASFVTKTLLATLSFTATGSFTLDTVTASWVPTASYGYYQLEHISGGGGDREFYEVRMYSSVSVGGGVTDHTLLSGRATDDQHPASAVTVADTAGWFADDTVETTLAEGAAKMWGYLGHGNAGSTETFDAVIGYHSATLNADCTFTLTAAASGTVSSLFLELTQDGTGGWAITLPASVVNKTDLEADQDTTADETTFLALFSRDGGTTWYGGWWASGGGTSGRWELAVIPGSPPDPLYADGDYLYIFVP